MAKNVIPNRGDFEQLLIDGLLEDAFKFLHDFVVNHYSSLRNETLLLIVGYNHLKAKQLIGIGTNYERESEIQRHVRWFLNILDDLESKQLLGNEGSIAHKTTSLIEVEIDCPSLLKISVQQYLIYFNEFVKVAKGEDIYFEVQKTDAGLSISLINQKSIPLTQIQQWLDEYIGLLKQDEDRLQFVVKEDVNKNTLDILIADLRNQIAHLKNSIEILNLKNMFLQQENDFIKSLNSKEVLRIDPENQFTSSDRIKKLIQAGNVHFP